MARLLRIALRVGAAAFGGLILATLTLAAVDLYLTGHGRQALGERSFLDVDAVGVYLSVADGLALGFACAWGLAAMVVLLREPA